MLYILLFLTPPRLVFLTLLLHSPPHVLSSQSQTIQHALKSCIANPDRDPTLRLNMLTHLDTLLEHPRAGKAVVGALGVGLVEHVVTPALAWRAGR